MFNMRIIILFFKKIFYLNSPMFIITKIAKSGIKKWFVIGIRN
jgi:hypothetical protein